MRRARGQEAQRSDLQLKGVLAGETEANPSDRQREVRGVLRMEIHVRGLCESGPVRPSIMLM